MISISSLLPKDVSFWDYDDNKKAREAFFELVRKCNFAYQIFNNKIVVKTMMDEVVGTFLIVGANLEQKVCYFPEKELLPVKENDYVAIVLFDQGQPINIFVFDAQELSLGKKHRLYKNSHKNAVFGVKIKKYKSRVFRKQQFGVIFNKFIKLGEK